MNWLMIIGLVVIGIVVVVIVIGALFCGDLMSYMATGSQALSPAGAPIGKALVVYNPGVTGAAKNAAATIAGDLQSKGYTVVLAGVRSAAAANASGYDIVAAGGPIYFGTSSNTIAAYLKGLTLQNNVKLGVFGTTGSNDFVASDLASVETQVASLQGGKKAAVKLIPDRDEKKADQGCADLVSAMAQ